jgi:uncharacterized protein YfaS (alpha-2-macroglobulin family)
MRPKRVAGCLLLLLSASICAYAEEGTRIEFFSPQGTVKGVRQVAARFSEQMVPFGDPRGLIDPFEIDCPEAGTARWADGKNWIYDFDRDLPAGIRCRFLLKEGVKSLAGNEIQGERQFQFSTGGPAIRRSRPFEGTYSGVDEEQIFILTLDAEPTEASVLSNVSFSIDGLFEKVGIRIIQGEEREKLLKTQFRTPPTGSLLLIQSKQRFPPDAKIVLNWGKGIVSKGGVATEQDQRLHFRSRALFTAQFHCEREHPDMGCFPIASMSLCFSAPVPWEAARKILLKASSGQQWKAELDEYAGESGEEKERSVYRIQFKAPFPASTDFKIEIPPALADDAGRRLSNADRFPLPVKTDRYPPLAKFPARFGVLEWKGAPVLPITLRNLEPEVRGRMLQAKRSVGILGKAQERMESLKGSLFRVSPEQGAEQDNGEEIFSWLKRVLAYDEREYQAREKSIFDTVENKLKSTTLTIPKPQGKEAFEVVGLPLKEPGFYIVEIESALLGEALLSEARPMFVPTAALVTNLSIHFKWGRESSLAWVTTLDTAAPVDHATVTVRDCRGKILWEGVTDPHGIARIGTLPTPGEVSHCSYAPLDHGLFVTARKQNDMTFVHSSWERGIEPWRFQLPHEPYLGPMIAHTVFDRTLFRTGETVHMKHLLRKHVTGGFSFVAEASRPKTLSIHHRGSDEKYTFPLQWGPTGSAENDWTIPKEAKLGTYDLLLDRIRSGEFRVEAFRVPLMKGAIKPPERPLVAASEATVDLNIQYLAGGGAGLLPVKLRGLIQPKGLSAFDGFENFLFANGGVEEGIVRNGEGSFEEGDEDQETAPSARDRNRFSIQTVDLVLDAAGGARTTLANLPRGKVPMEILAELEFKDPNGEIETISSKIPLWPARRLVGIKPDSWALSKERVQFQVAVVDLSGQPVSGAPVEVDLYERKVYSHRKRLIGGFYAYAHSTEIRRVDFLCRGATDARGLLICESASPVSGNVILQAKTTDGDGNEALSHHDLWIAGKAEWWFDVADSDRIDLLPGQKHYEPGEVAQFQVRMPFREATVLVTVEREGVIDSFVRRLSGKEPIVEVPIKDHYAPNVFISVLALRGRVGGIQPTATVDLGRPAYKLGIAEINVGWRAHELKVRVSPEREIYKVRERAKVKISAKTAAGEIPPPGTEVIVAAVDEGLLELMPNRSWDLLSGMMRRRGYEVETATVQMHVVGKRHFGLKALPSGGSGGRQTTRELFEPLLFWKGSVLLDGKGEASVEIPLNDSITGFRIVAVASGGAGFFGTGTASIRSTQELMLFSGLSPLVREGDRFHAEFTLRNASERAMEIDLAGRIDQQPLQPQKISLQPGEGKRVGWPVTAPVGVDLLLYEIEAREKGGGSDRIKISQKVVEAVPTRVFQATLAQIERNFQMTVARPEDAISDRGGIRLFLRPSLLDGMGGVIDYMKRYPYRCLEQQLSRAVALRDHDLWKETMAALPSSLDRNGLAKYFPTLLSGSEALTTYLIALADEAGWEIPEPAAGRMKSALMKFIQGALHGHAPIQTADLSIRKLAAAEALSRSGMIEPRHLESISIEPNLWPTSAVLDWMNLLRRVETIPNREKRLEETEQIVRSRLHFQGTTMGFSTERSDFLWWQMISNDTNAVRAILSLLGSDRWREDLPRMVRGALARQRRGAWDLTTANAWGVLAMEKFAKTFEAVPVSGESRAVLSGETQTLDWSRAPKGETLTFSWPTGEKEITLQHQGAGKPWATVQSLAAIPLKAPFSSGYRIKKTFIPLEQKEPGRWSVGDLIRVRLEIESQADMTWVVANDPIPAGATILGSGLGRDSKIATGGETRKGWVWPSFEERTFEAFRAYYEYLPKGSWTVEYTIRLNQEGTASLPATRVEAMYAPEMFGEIPNPKMEVSR